MSWHQHLKIPKKLKQVTLWIHPEGRVIGSLFLSLHSKYSSGAEAPLETLNHADPFLVLKREDADELRFYNKSSIVRVEYPKDGQAPSEGLDILPCRLYLMDGSMVEGVVRRALPPDHSRLYDYLNMHDERFAEIHTEDDVVCLINKSYIVYVTSLSERRGGHAEWQASEFDTSNYMV